MAILSAQQIYNLAIEAGFSPADATNATAIALAESGGNTSVVNSIGATGLFQIYNGKGQNGLNDPTFRANMQDPLLNAKAAFAKFTASQQTTCGGWWPWASYNEGPCHNSDPNRNNSWRNFFEQALGVSQSGDTSGEATSDTSSSVVSGAALVTAQSQTSSASDTSSAPSLFGSEALGKITSRLASPGFWWSVGFFLLAGLMILLGLIIYFRKEVTNATFAAAKAVG